MASPTLHPFDVAYQLLGPHFVSPEAVSKTSVLADIRYSPELLDHFVKTVPDEEVLLFCQQQNYILMPGPPSPLCLIEVRQTFGRKAEGWYSGPREMFSLHEKVRPEWLMMRKHATPTQSLTGYRLLSYERLPTMAELTWCTAVYKEVSDERLFAGQHIYTSSRSADRHPVTMHSYEVIGDAPQVVESLVYGVVPFIEVGV